jgi:prefoldin subunit 5
MSDMHRDIGRHDAQIEALQAQVDRLHLDMTTVLSELRTINATLSEAKGGWKTLLAVGAIASGMTAFAMKILGFLFSK